MSKRSYSEFRQQFLCLFTDRKGYSAMLPYSKRTPFVCYWCYRCQIIYWWIHRVFHLFCFGMYSRHLCTTVNLFHKASDEWFASLSVLQTSQAGILHVPTKCKDLYFSYRIGCLILHWQKSSFDIVITLEDLCIGVMNYGRTESTEDDSRFCWNNTYDIYYQSISVLINLLILTCFPCVS